jgi:hypothetical protein
MERNWAANDKRKGNPPEPLIERTGERSSPGSGEDESGEGAADLQPDEVEGGDTAR